MGVPFTTIRTSSGAPVTFTRIVTAVPGTMVTLPKPPERQVALQPLLSRRMWV